MAARRAHGAGGHLPQRLVSVECAPAQGQVHADARLGSRGAGNAPLDIANAAYSWAPLAASGGRGKIDEQARRLGLFVDAYGLEDRKAVLPTLRLRVQHVARFITEQAALGDPGMQRLVWWNVPAQMQEDDVRYLDEHWKTLERALSL